MANIIISEDINKQETEQKGEFHEGKEEDYDGDDEKSETISITTRGTLTWTIIELSSVESKIFEETPIKEAEVKENITSKFPVISQESRTRLWCLLQSDFNDTKVFGCGLQGTQDNTSLFKK